MFIVILGILYNPNFQFYLRASRCSEGCVGTLLPVTFLNGHINKTHLMYALWPVPYTSNGTSWTMVSSMHGTHFKYYLLIPPLVFNNNLSLLIYGCMCVGSYDTYIDIWVG